MGRVVQERYGQDPQVALTMPLLVGTDGTKKMSQSLGNYIGVDDKANEMFGKTMSLPDVAMPEWFRLAADLDPDDVADIEAGLNSGELHPGETKRRLARAVVALYWGEEATGEAEAAFDRVFKEGGVPDEIDEYQMPADDPVQMPALIRDVFGVSGAEVRRLITQGAVKIDGETVTDLEMARADLVSTTLKVGKRRFARLVD